MATKTNNKPSRRPPTDEDVANWSRLARETPEVRQQLIRRIKAEIAAGTYETPERVRIALQRLLEDL